MLVFNAREGAGFPKKPHSVIAFDDDGYMSLIFVSQKNSCIRKPSDESSVISDRLAVSATY